MNNISEYLTRAEAEAALRAYLATNRQARGYVAQALTGDDSPTRWHAHVSCNGSSRCL